MRSDQHTDDEYTGDPDMDAILLAAALSDQRRIQVRDRLERYAIAHPLTPAPRGGATMKGPGWNGSRSPGQARP